MTMVGMSRRLVLVLVVLLTLLSAGPATAQDEGDGPATTIGAEESPGIIPEPNQGAEPQDAGDRGGALQTLLFVLIVGSTLGIGAVVVRQSRRARAERGF